MDENMKMLRLCFLSLRLMGLSSWAMENSGRKWVTKRSRFMSVVNTCIVSGFLYIFIKVTIHQHRPTIYKSSAVVFPLFTQFLLIVNMLFILCGNLYNGKFVDIINHFPPVLEKLKWNFDLPPFRSRCDIKRIFVRTFIWMGTMAVVKLYVEYHLVLTYPRSFRFIHFFTSFAVTLFSMLFIVTMAFIRDNYAYVNSAFRTVTSSKNKEPKSHGHGYGHSWTTLPYQSVFGGLSSRTTVSIWTSAFMELRQIEGLVNQVFGKQIFLTLLIAFSAMIINIYYFVTLNLYKTSNVWLNICFLFGLFEAVAVFFANIKAAEMTSREANQINEDIFYFPLAQNNWCLYNQLKYFMLFIHHYPTQFRAWVFYTVSYSSFFKVMAASSAISIVFLQCEFMRPIIK